MKLASIGAIIVGLALVLASAFVLNRGVLLRADIELPIFGGPPWPSHCKYLTLRGTFRDPSVASDDQENPSTTFCPFLRRQSDRSKPA